jgi:ribosomal protein L11 methyltransferase
MLIGERFFICPEWRDDATPPGRLRIEVNPGMAFGTGAHETTQLCLEALERQVRPGVRVLDVGTGSGILCDAALQLGASAAIGCDHDADAAPIARQKVATVYVGSADAAASNAFDIVVANIAARPVIELAGDLVRCIRRGGVLLLSGFEGSEVPLIKAAFPGAVTRVFARRTWRLVEVHRSG